MPTGRLMDRPIDQTKWLTYTNADRHRPKRPIPHPPTLHNRHTRPTHPLCTPGDHRRTTASILCYVGPMVGEEEESACSPGKHSEHAPKAHARASHSGHARRALSPRQRRRSRLGLRRKLANELGVTREDRPGAARSPEQGPSGTLLRDDGLGTRCEGILVVRKDFTGSRLVVHRWSTGTTVVLHGDCAVTARVRNWCCTGPALVLRGCCTGTALVLHRHCTGAGTLVLLWHYTGTALVLNQHQRSTRATPLY